MQSIPEKALSLIIFKDLGKVNVPPNGQFENAHVPISVTPFGITKEPERLVWENAEPPILVIFSGKTNRIKVDLFANTLSGISFALNET